MDLEEVVCFELLVRPLEEQLDGLLQVGALGGRVIRHCIQGSPVQPPCRRVIPAIRTHTHPLSAPAPSLRWKVLSSNC